MIRKPVFLHTLETLGKIIATERSRIPLTQQGLADLAEVSRTSVQRLEEGREATFSTIVKILRVLNLMLIIDTYQKEEKIENDR
jgi:predicted transcriptional regulator